MDVNDKIAKVSIVGAGMVHNPGVAAKMFEALYNAGINISMISTSEIKVSVLVDINEADRIAFASIPFMKRESHCVIFFDKEGKVSFSVYLGRENHQIIESVKAAFFASKEAFCA